MCPSSCFPRYIVNPHWCFTHSFCFSLQWKSLQRLLLYQIEGFSGNSCKWLFPCFCPVPREWSCMRSLKFGSVRFWIQIMNRIGRRWSGPFVAETTKRRGTLYLKLLVNMFTQVPPYTWNSLLRDITKLNACTCVWLCEWWGRTDLTPLNGRGKWRERKTGVGLCTDWCFDAALSWVVLTELKAALTFFPGLCWEAHLNS